MFASHNGDFGANDTILYSSAYNNIIWLFFTDEQARIKKVFDGNKLFFFDYDSDYEVTILDLSTNTSKHHIRNSTSEAKSTRGFFSSKTLFTNVTGHEGFIGFLEDMYMASGTSGYTNLVNVLNHVGNNPELHNQLFIVDALSIVGDLVGIGASLLATAPTGGWTIAGLAASTLSLMDDFNTLCEHIWPNGEQMKKYSEYYQDKYVITLKTEAPENVKCDKAELRGTFMSLNGVKGKLFFSFFDESFTSKSIEGTLDPVTSNSYIIKGTATGLKPGECSFYGLRYECVVDGLKFTYDSDDIADFVTTNPSAVTLDVVSVNENSAIVKCSYSNVPEGAACGVSYDSDWDTGITTTSSSEGEHTINLSGLQPATSYNYRAIIQYNGESYYGETKTFTTEAPDISGSWTCNETHYDRTGAAYYVTYTVTLNKDGSVHYSNSDNILSSSWSLLGNGNVSIDITDLATQTANSGVRWRGQVDSMEHPTKITGSTNRWNYNNIGAFEGEYYEFEMKR